MKIDTSDLDLMDQNAIKQKSKDIIEAIWADYIEGVPLVVVVNVTAYLNAQALAQFDDPHQLLYAVEKNAGVIEQVIHNLADRIGPEKVQEALEQSDASLEEDGDLIPPPRLH